MRSFIVIGTVIGVLAAGNAIAQPPAEVAVTDIVKLQPGEPRTYEFAEPVTRIGATIEGVVAITAQTDRMFTFYGIAPGQVLVVAHSDGRIIHQMLVDVATAGRLVKIHKPTKGGEDENYTSYQCTETACGRADPDLQKPSSQSKQVTRTNSRGDSVTTTKNY